ncbi:hypothetical protein IFM89_012241 [Coptis chinensis]|uniref:Uncharacterized protein n=1 Tax=Coptis chinensis TaxID=261450 RepID=A0A835HA27_9MAGN|nr:hypothetical protein IFM89_012241 [Coptis chinensis]
MNYNRKCSATEAELLGVEFAVKMTVRKEFVLSFDNRGSRLIDGYVDLCRRTSVRKWTCWESTLNIDVDIDCTLLHDCNNNNNNNKNNSNVKPKVIMEISGMPTSLKGATSKAGASPDVVGEPSSSSASRGDRADNSQPLQADKGATLGVIISQNNQ